MSVEKEFVLQVDNVSVEFDGQSIIEGISFNVKKGESLAIVGPNGAGKSTLFRALLDLIPYQGIITWKAGLKIGYVPQNLGMEKSIPLTVKDFLGFKSNSEVVIREALSRVGIRATPENEHHVEHHIMARPMGKLSGGEFQRVLIAWALLDKPDVLLVDEPTSGIDIGGEETIYNLLKRLQREEGLSILLISHDLNIVYRYANTVICLNKQQVCFGIPTEVLDPESLKQLYGGETEFYAHEHAASQPSVK